MVKIEPYINIGPGDIIKRNLKALNWTQNDLTSVLGISKKSVNQIIKNKQSISIEVAKLLSKAFGTTPEFWLNLDNNYRLRKHFY